jgi:hypothetical protein
VKLKLLRRSDTRTVEVELGKRPQTVDTGAPERPSAPEDSPIPPELLP